MTPADIDPSLCTEPVLESLDDGFSPPATRVAEAVPALPEQEPASLSSPQGPLQG